MIVASIAHAAHKPERAATMRAMCDMLEADNVPFLVDRQPGKPHEWSLRQWRSALALASDHHATHCLLLNDDLILCERFIGTLCNAIAAQPGSILSLYNEDAMASRAASLGIRWLTSRDGMMGTAYVMPSHILRDFLDWREGALVPGAVERLSEDQLVNLYAMCHGIYIWHTVPALVDHAQVESCYGNRSHRPTVGPHKNMPTEWNTDALHVGRVFKGNHWLMLTHVKPEMWRKWRLIERAYEVHGDVLPVRSWMPT